MQRDISAISAWIPPADFASPVIADAWRRRFSSRAIESDYFAHLHRGAQTQLSLAYHRNPPTVEAVYRAAADGDPSAQCVMTRASEYLAAALVSFVNMFDPEVIILAATWRPRVTNVRSPAQGSRGTHSAHAGKRCADHSTECYWLRWCCGSGGSRLSQSAIAENMRGSTCERGCFTPAHSGRDHGRNALDDRDREMLRCLPAGWSRVRRPDCLRRGRLSSRRRE
jgi:predicted NBD/HSP70 family sugar kinase